MRRSLNLLRTFLLSALLTGWGPALFYGCKNHQDNHEHEHAQDHNHSEEEHREGAGADHEADTLTFTPEQVRLMDIAVASVRRLPFSDGIQVTGRLELYPQNRASVSVPLPAIVERIEVIEGDRVRKGMPIAYVSHPSYIELQEEYLRLRARLPYLRSEFRRLEELHKQGFASTREYQRAYADYHEALARLKALTATLLTLNIDTARLNRGEVTRLVPVLAPITGYVHKIRVHIGELVEGGTPIAELAENRKMHADFRIYEKDVWRVREGMRVLFRVAGKPNLYVARIHALSPAFETDVLSVHAHAHLDNSVGDLMPGMYVEGRILLQEDTHLVVPSRAITHVQGKPVVFVAVDTGAVWRFVPVEVRPVAEVLEHTAIYGPLSEGMLVAVSATPLLAGELQKELLVHEH